MPDVQEANGQEPQVTTNDETVNTVEQGGETVNTEQSTNDSQVAPDDSGKPETFDREYVEQLRKEAAENRVKAKEHAEAVTKATSEKDDFINTIGKALGFIKDEDAEQADANKIVEQLTAERDTTAKELRQLREENALSKAVTSHGADDSLTIAYLRGTGVLADLDPAADDYADQVSQVVAAAVESNPKLAAQAAVRQSSVDTTNTNVESPQITRDDLKNMTAAEINAAARDGKLNHLMTK